MSYNVTFSNGFTSDSYFRSAIASSFNTVFTGINTIHETSGKDDIYNTFFGSGQKDAVKNTLRGITDGIARNATFNFKLPENVILGDVSTYLTHDIDGIYIFLAANENTNIQQQNIFNYYVTSPVFRSLLDTSNLQLLLDTNILYNIFLTHFRYSPPPDGTLEIPCYVVNLGGVKNLVSLNSQLSIYSPLNYLFFYLKFLSLESRTSKLADTGIQRLYMENMPT